MSIAYQAACSCGQLRFQSSDPPVLQLVCHCTDCREVSGNPFTRLVFFKRRAIEIVGQSVSRKFKSQSGNLTRRESCPQCGGLLFDCSDGFKGLIGVLADQLDEAFEFQPLAHVWTESKLSGTEIPADLIQYARNFEP